MVNFLSFQPDTSLHWKTSKPWGYCIASLHLTPVYSPSFYSLIVFTCGAMARLSWPGWPVTQQDSLLIGCGQ